MKNKLMFLMLSLMMGSYTFAHEGHNHTPGSIQAPHGGVIKGTSELYMELVSDASGLKFYPLTHELKAIPLSELKVSGTYQMPKKKKEKLTLSSFEDHFETKVESKGAYRYALQLETIFKTKKESVTFQVEP